MIYLYCVTDKVPEIKGVENLTDKPYFIYQHGLYAVVSRVSKDEFSEENFKRNLCNMEWIERKARVHEEVIEGVMRDATVVPFKFATLFNTEDSLKAVLEEHAEELKMSLRNLEGKEEWGVKIYCDTERLEGHLIRENGEFSKMDKEIISSAPGKAFFLKKKREEMLNTMVDKRLNEYAQEVFGRLREESVQSRINRLLLKEVTEREEEMILNSAFLIHKDKVPDFLSTVKGLRTGYADKGLIFDCTGPWPPYNFCSLSVDRS